MSCPARNSCRLYRQHIDASDHQPVEWASAKSTPRRAAAIRRMGYWLFGSIREDESPKRDLCFMIWLTAIRA